MAVHALDIVQAHVAVVHLLHKHSSTWTIYDISTLRHIN